MLIHFWKALNTNLKSNLSLIYIYKGYSRQQLAYILHQMNIPATLNELYNVYIKLDEHEKLVIDSIYGAYYLLWFLFLGIGKCGQDFLVNKTISCVS